MNKLAIFLSVFYAIGAFAQGNNPYKGLGEEAEKLGSEILTLSQGRYNEFHDNDTIVRIGDALYNVYTHKIVGFVVEEGHSEATMKPEVVSMWLSVDPLARKFPELTPYNFVEGNPVMLIDPNGLSAEPPDGFQGEFWEDETGKYYNVGAVTGNNSDFVKQGSDGENGFYNSGTEMLGEVTVDGGKMSDLARSYQNPIANAVREGRGQAAEVILEVAMMAAPIPAGLPIKGMRAALAAKGGSQLAKYSGILRDAAKFKGNFGLGKGTASEALELGKAWVGKGYTTAGNGKIFISKNGLRQFRMPSHKPKLGIHQANFEWRNAARGRWQGNGHLDIIK